MKKKKNKKKIILVLIPVLIIALVVLAFGVWFIKPTKKLNIAVLDTTVPATDGQGITQTNRYYRKHSGFFWLLNQQKYVKENGKKYNYRKDYFGPLIDENGEYTGENNLSDFKTVPDLLYLADVYGSELYDNKYAGLSTQDMNTVSLTHSMGGTVVGEMELLGSTKDESVCNDIKELFGFTTTSWSGRYVVDLSDMSDVPSWAPPAYENQYGVKWKFTGPGIILASSTEGIIVLEEKTDFNSKNLISIDINSQFKKEFSGCKKSNFYNWFELVETQNGTDTIADYTLNLNAVGMEKIKKISSDSVFAAIIRKKVKNGGDTYYFAGDFNDSTSDEKIYNFLGAERFFKALSFDKDGDISQFYWKFYNPLMKKILKDTYKNKDNIGGFVEKTEELQSKVSENKFKIKDGNEFKDFNMKAVNVNLNQPGSDSASRNYNYYKEMLDQAQEMGINTVRVYTLAPPEFYRALYEVNKNNENKLYLIQTINAESDDNEETWKTNVDTILNAVHGTGQTKDLEGNILRYIHNVSPFLLSYIVNIDVTKNQLEQWNSNNTEYSGKYVSTHNGSTVFYAKIIDYICDKNNSEYSHLIPVGAHIDVDKIEGAYWNLQNINRAILLSGLQFKNSGDEYFYVSSALNVNDSVFRDNQKKFVGFSDAEGNFYYGGYVQYIKNLVSPYSFMVDGFGASTNAKIYAVNDTYSGLSETTQGEAVVRMLDAILTEGCMGGIISDLNDSWSGVSDGAKASIVPLTNNSLWHNLDDPAQTTGILAVKAEEPKDIGLELKDFETMKKIQLSVNPEYFYITLSLEKEIDYNTNELIIGLDTYQRNDGEYFYNKAYFANSLSGMEYIIRITGPKAAALYVCSSYSRNGDTVTSRESYDGKWTKVFDLECGNFSSTTSHFFIGSTNVRIRIPWSALNVTDPSQRVVIEQKTKFNGQQYSTTITNGFVPSVFVGNKESGDTEYIFPLTKQSVGYKTYKYATWETVDYTVERKGSYGIIQSYLKSYR